MKEEKKRILKMVMSLGHSEQEAKGLLEKMGDAFCKKFMQLVHEENARLRKNEFSKNKNNNSYLLISTIFYFFIGQMFIFRNTLQGMGVSLIPLLASSAELFVRMFAAIYLAIHLGYTGIFYAGPIAWLVAALIVAIGYFLNLKSIAIKTIKS